MPIYGYKYRAPDRWDRYVLSHECPRDGGLCVMDVDGDGWLDLVTGSSWYRSSRDLRKPFQKILDHARKTNPWLLVLGRIGVHSAKDERALTRGVVGAPQCAESRQGAKPDQARRF